MSEVWKAVPGYEGKYEVSDQGRVRSLDRIVEAKNQTGKVYYCHYKGRILKVYNNSSGYFALCMAGKMFLLHRLVAKVFIPNSNNLPEVNHKDENKHNNRVDNLEWCTRRYNANYGTGKVRCGQMSWVPVIATDKDGNEYRFESMTEAAEKTGAGFRNISMCCQGAKGRPTAGGYKWRYA
jgi:hypothetical protein